MCLSAHPSPDSTMGVTDSCEIWYEEHATGGKPILILLLNEHSAVLWTCKLITTLAKVLILLLQWSTHAKFQPFILT